jgi:UDP-N-acetylmuramate--alanine ligase
VNASIGRRWHLIGVGGSGMSGLARLLLGGGATVSGSDLVEGAEVAALRALGARIHIGHDPEHVPDDVDGVIVSSAIPDDNREIVAARARGFRIVPRLDALGAILASHRSIGVAGTHGKTTTAAMVATILRFAGYQPSHYIGEHCPGLGCRSGTDSGSWFVAEIDESDGRFCSLHPEIGVVTNIDTDHLMTYGSMGALRGAFDAFARGVGRGVLGIDDPRVRAIAERCPEAMTAGFSKDAHVRCTRVDRRGASWRFLLEVGGRRVGWVPLPAAGEHNVRNALCAIAAAAAAGVPAAIAAWALTRFVRPSRRFEVLHRGSITVVDDYAHHPRAVQATVATARSVWVDRRLVCVFQPHRYSRVRRLADGFSTCFAGSDTAVVTDIYAAGERPLPGATVDRILDAVAGGTPSVDLHHVSGAPALRRFLRTTLEPGDVLLGLGAGDLTTVVHEVARELSRTASR